MGFHGFHYVVRYIIFSEFFVFIVWFLEFADKIDGGLRTEAEEKVYSWLYALARSDKDLVFEYVRSTERGENRCFLYLRIYSLCSRTLDTMPIARPLDIYIFWFMACLISS